MQAMLLKSPHPVSESPLILTELPDPRPAQGQIRIKVSACGVCHTDLHIVEGELRLPSLPIIPGHQIIGEIDQIGSGVETSGIGRRVGIAWLNLTCGECEFCRNGLENLCPRARFTGLHADGGYAQYAVVNHKFAFPIPENFTDAQAAPLLCAGIIGFRSLHQCEIKPGENLGLYGFGASAHIVIQIARHWNCRVYVFTRGSEHRHLAEELGAVWTGSAEETPPEKLHASITFAPVGRIVPQALKHLRPGGTLAINAVFMSALPELEYPLLYEERTIRSVANFTRTDALEFLSLAGQIPVRTEVEVFPLEEANAVLQRLKKSLIRGSAVLKMA